MPHNFHPIFRLKFWLAAGVLLLAVGHGLSYADTDPIRTSESSFNPSTRQRFGLTDSSDKKDAGASQRDRFHFDQELWNEMRRNVEDGREPGVAVSTVSVSTITAQAPKPPPGQLKVELPYESSLSITGRKVIRVDITNTHINRERADELRTKQDSQSFNMQQQLQARIQGTVARKTTINVNYDDTKDNVKDFSVIYKGDPDEVVQEAAFGDIVLSLPSTEFVNYNKQLFGIRTALKYKKAGLMFIGSRTKGTTETKRFTGTTTRNQAFVNDTAYIRRKFYDLTFSTAAAMYAAGGPFSGKSLNNIVPIRNDPELVYVEDTTGIDPNARLFSIATPTGPATGLTLRMKLMSPGVDYSIDRTRGIITFTNPVAESVRIAIDFTLNDGSRLSTLVSNLGGGSRAAVLIKDRTPETAQVSQEIKRFYFIGSRNILRDNGLGNFILKVLDKNRQTEIGPSLNPVQRYPDTIEVNFESGIFELRNHLPFPEVYASNVNSGSPLQATFSVEFQSILRTYTLRPNIVLQSEVVEVNGRKVSRDLDYFIDYDIGIITFFNPDLIRESTVIEVTYEFAPFGGQLGETLVGTRGTLDLATNKTWGPVGMGKWAAGSTVLYNFGAKPTGPPDIRSTPSSLLVVEGDTSVKDLKIGNLPVRTNLAVESARSEEDPNLFGRAVVDSMEGIKQDDSAPLLRDSWQPAAGLVDSAAPGFNTVPDFRGRDVAESHLRWNEVDVTATGQTNANTTQRALQISYQLNTGTATTREQVSLVNIISLAGRDFSKKTNLEVEVFGAGSAGADVDLVVEYGTFNEDADGDGVLDTEDVIPFDGVLNLGEDVGYVFNGPGSDLNLLTTGDNVNTRIGSNNGRLDSEDLNGDRVLNRQDISATFKPIFSLREQRPRDTQGRETSDLNFPTDERRLFQIPINVAQLSLEERTRLTSVKQVRVTIRNRSAASQAKTGSFIISRLSMVGNTWEPATLSGSSVLSTMTVRAVNNKDDSFYIPLFGHPDYNNLYKGISPASDAKEQALALDYELQAGASATTRNAFSLPRDLSKHDFFKFFLRRKNSCGSVDCGGEFFFQAGSESEYQEVVMDIANIPDTQWRVVTLEQSDTNHDGTPDTWISNDPAVTVRRVGNVTNLAQVAQFKAGIRNTSGSTVRNQLWLNEIHVVEPNKRVGQAKKYSFDTTWARWMDLGGSFREVDRNWQTPTTAITNQDRTQENAYINLNRISFLPMTFKTNREKTATPSAFRSNQNALVSVLQEGRVESRSNSSTAKLIIPKLPVFDFGYDNSESKANLTQRKESNDAWRAGMSYSPTARPDLLPGFLTFRPIPTSLSYLHSEKVTKLRFSDAASLLAFNVTTAPFSSTNLTQYTNEDEVRLSFRPWDGFSFNPTYKLRVDTERRDFRDDEKAFLPAVTQLDHKRTPRSISQNISAGGNLLLLKWLDPRYSYSFSGTETNNLPTQSNTTGYLFKTITRNSQAEVSATTSLQQVLPRVKILNTMNLNTSYKLENGDTYKDMPNDFNWRGKLWAGNPLIDVSTGTLARRTDATDRRTFRTNMSWQPFSVYQIANPRLKPFSTLSLTSNYLRSRENTETTGTQRRTDSQTWPDLIMTMNNSEDLFRINKMIVSNSRLVLKTNTRKTETQNVNKNVSRSYGTDFNFQFRRKYDVATTFNVTRSQDDNLVTKNINSKSDTTSYSVQTRIPWRVWAFTPRYERSETNARDSIRITNDLVAEAYSLQIYGDIAKPLGIRFGRKEIGVANRLILNSTIKWDKKRSSVNPGTNYLDIYSATLSGDYTLSQNFRLAIGGNFSQEVHHPDFKKLDKSTFGINSTLTIQF